MMNKFQQLMTVLFCFFQSVADAVRKEIEDNAESYQYTNHYINIKIEAVEQLRHRAKQMVR